MNHTISAQSDSPSTNTSKCPICLSEDVETPEQRLLPCMHMVCRGCFSNLRQHQCPICRHDFSRNMTASEVFAWVDQRNEQASQYDAQACQYQEQERRFSKKACILTASQLVAVGCQLGFLVAYKTNGCPALQDTSSTTCWSMASLTFANIPLILTSAFLANSSRSKAQAARKKALELNKNKIQELRSAEQELSIFLKRLSVPQPICSSSPISTLPPVTTQTENLSSEGWTDYNSDPEYPDDSDSK